MRPFGEACNSGHKLTQRNTLISRGRRFCRICKRARERASGKARRAAARLAAGKVMKSEQTHCKHAHEYTPENTYRKPNGTRDCRACRRRRLREAYARRKAAPV